jgi:hypothetical protein
MLNLVKIRAQAAICMQRAASDSSNRAHWLAEAERWSSLAQDEIDAHFADCNLFSQVRVNQLPLDHGIHSASSLFAADSTRVEA